MQKRGVTIHDETQVVDLVQASGCVEVITEQQTYVGAQAVVCGGVWSGQVATRLNLKRSIVPVRGQMLLLKAPRRALSRVVNLGHRYAVPRRDGHVLIGSTEEEVGFQRGTTPQSLSSLRDFVAHVFGEAGSFPEVDAWSGLRPMTFDYFPMCGRVPDWDALFVATGHFRSGIHLSIGTALCMADVMSERSPTVSLEPFRVGRHQQSTHQVSIESAIS